MKKLLAFFILIFVFAFVLCAEEYGIDSYSSYSIDTYSTYSMESYEAYSTDSYENYSIDTYEYFSAETYAYFDNTCYEQYGIDSYCLYTNHLAIDEFQSANITFSDGSSLNLAKVFTKLGVGAGVTLITSFVLPAVFPEAAPVTAVLILRITKEALIGAACDAVTQAAITYVKTGDSQKAMYKAVEGAADGYMWGAIFASGAETIKAVRTSHQMVRVAEKATVFEQSQKDAKILGDNLVKSGIPRPLETAAHHIVEGDHRAARARAVFQKFGIDINDARNGVFLPYTEEAHKRLGRTYHRTMHTDKYYNAVNSLMETATSKQDVFDILDIIREYLLNDNLGEFLTLFG